MKLLSRAMTITGFLLALTQAGCGELEADDLLAQGGAPTEEVAQSQTQALTLEEYFAALQAEVQAENRRATTLSNAVRASHDTAKAAVNAIRQ